MATTVRNGRLRLQYDSPRDIQSTKPNHSRRYQARMYSSLPDPNRPPYPSIPLQQRYKPRLQPPLNPHPRRRQQEPRQVQIQIPRPQSDRIKDHLIADDNNLLPDPEHLPVNRSHRYPIFEQAQEDSARYGRPPMSQINSHSRSYSAGRQIRSQAQGQYRIQMNGHRAARSIDRRGLPTYVSPELNRQQSLNRTVEHRITPTHTPSPILHRNSLSRSFSLDPLEQSLEKSRKRSKQKRRVECLGIFFFSALLAATIGGYAFLVYRSHFWVDDYLAKKYVKLPSWLHVIVTFSIMVEIVLVIAFVTRYKHAH